MHVNDSIKKFISKRRFAFVGSIDEDGFPNVKAMIFPHKVVDCREYYFSTNTSSSRVQQFSKNQNACLYFCSLILFKGIMLRGKMEVLHDQTLKNELWKKGDTQYYPKGVTDPDYCILRFTVDDSAPRSYRI